MAWVPLVESGLEYTLTLPTGVVWQGSYLVATSAVNPDWQVLVTVPGSALQLPYRITITDFAVSGGVVDAVQDVAEIQWTQEDSGESQANEASNALTDFVPAVFEFLSDVTTDVEYNCTEFVTGDAIESWRILIEVDNSVFPPQPSVGYNCSCDDDYPSRTLAQMRQDLMIRLGFAAQVNNPPPGMALLLDSFLREAQETAYRDYNVFRMERFFTWQMEPGVKFYDLPDNIDVCTKKLDPRKITWVGISNDDNWWYPLVCGINPTLYSFQASGWPTRYEIRQCIEVWPPPESDVWLLRIKGYFELLPFVADSDKTTIDYVAIALLALANAKAHYGQPDAGNYAQQYRGYVSNLVAGSHMTKRYVPGEAGWVPSPNPVWIPLS